MKDLDAVPIVTAGDDGLGPCPTCEASHGSQESGPCGSCGRLFASCGTGPDWLVSDGSTVWGEEHVLTTWGPGGSPVRKADDDLCPWCAP